VEYACLVAMHFPRKSLWFFVCNFA
jgi:hypothetical protein